MADEKTQKLLQGGIKAARNGDKALARRAFRQVIKLEPDNEAAWLGMATVAETTKEKLQALKQLLQINPDHPQAQEAVKRLGLTPERLLGTSSAQAADAADDDLNSDDAADEDLLDETADAAPDDALDDERDTYADEAKAALFGDDDVDDTYADEAKAALFGDDDDVEEDADDDLFSGSGSVFLSDDDADDEGVFTADDLGMDDDDAEASLWDDADELGDPSLTDSIEDITDAAETEDSADATGGNTLFLRDELGVGEEIDAADDDFFDEVAAETESIEPEPIEEEPPPPRKTSAEAFAEMPPPPRGDAGTPIPDDEALPQVARAAEEKTQAYLDRVLAEYQVAEWTQKRRGLAGAREHFVFLVQAGSAALLTLLIIGGGATAAILNSPEAQRILFAPTWTPSPTPTLTPTATPGVTNTPSPTPDPTLTPSPTLEPSVTPYPTDPNFPPEPTEFYRPQTIGQDLSQQSENAALLLLDDEFDEAFELLQEDIQASGTAQTYWSYYYLTQLYLQQDQLDEAQENVETGVEAIPETDLEEYQALINVSQARVDIYEARQFLAADNERDATPLLDDAEELLLEIVADDGIDRRFVEAYLLLAEVYQLQEEPEEALRILTGAINSGVTGDIYTDTRLRMARARIYRQQEDYAQALQEVNDVLLINPFLENALEFQVEVALAADQPGLAVLYSQQYLLYYPNSVRGYQLLGEARLAENKPDLALNAFSQGLQGDPDDPAYIDILITRGNIYRDQQRFDDAREDFNQALTLGGGDDFVIRLNRMRAAYIEGDYVTVLNDAEELLDNDNPEIPTGEILLLQGRIEVDQGEDYAEAVSLINRAINVVGIEADLRPIANEYLARAYLAQEEYDAALNSISAALEGAETGSRYYLLGQILEERGRERNVESDLERAVDAYEFVLTWGNIYPYAFIDDVRERYDDLIDELDSDDTA